MGRVCTLRNQRPKAVEAEWNYYLQRNVGNSQFDVANVSRAGDADGNAVIMDRRGGRLTVSATLLVKPVKRQRSLFRRVSSVDLCLLRRTPISICHRLTTAKITTEHTQEEGVCLSCYSILLP